MVGGAVAPLLVNQASADARFANHPGLTQYGIESYIAVPLLRRDGTYFGTLCALDPRPARLNEEDFAIFRLLADLIAFELEADEEEAARERQLMAARAEAALREQFIGVLGHDLRTPITAIRGFVESLQRSEAIGGRDAERLGWIATSAERMGQMIADLLDFTRGRLGGGIPVEPAPVDLHDICRQAVRELTHVGDGDRIEMRLTGDGHGCWDAGRLAQVVTNLLANALEYSPPASPVRLSVEDAGGWVRLAVHNQGRPIPPALQAVIFDPFRRARTDAAPGRLGLGLYIVQQIALAHAGNVEVASSEKAGTTFSVLLPRNDPEC